jgi:hypothetical protein
MGPQVWTSRVCQHHKKKNKFIYFSKIQNLCGLPALSGNGSIGAETRTWLL